jgi:RNA polymerase sigma-70 factor (ECF subfamily)
MKRVRLADEQLVDLYKDTNADEPFNALYDRYVGKVYKTCLSFTKDSEEAQDYTQEVFIKVLNKLDTFQNRSTFSTWLYAISQHYCLDQLKLKKKMSTEAISDELDISEPDVAESVENQMYELEILMNQLPAEDIKLLRLKHEQGMSIKDISQQYQLSESAVKMRLKRTRDKLLNLYTDYNQ